MGPTPLLTRSNRGNERATGSWTLAMPSPGVLRVRNHGPELRYDQVRDIAERLLAERVDRTLAEVVFDFQDVQAIEAPWTPVVAQLIDFARRSNASCRITALNGQPAAIIGLLLGDGACRSFLRIDDLPAA
jgi:anti-anti-sigma regulatory factor